MRRRAQRVDLTAARVSRTEAWLHVLRKDQPRAPLHCLCLFDLGVHLGELWWLSELAAHLRAAGRSRLLLTAPPLRLPRATGSPVTPIATV